MTVLSSNGGAALRDKITLAIRCQAEGDTLQPNSPDCHCSRDDIDARELLQIQQVRITRDDQIRATGTGGLKQSVGRTSP